MTTETVDEKVRGGDSTLMPIERATPRRGRGEEVDLGLVGEFGPSGVTAAARLARRLSRRVSGGTLVVTEEGFPTRRYGAGDPVVEVTVHDARAYAATLAKGSVGFGESYVAGWWDCDDLTSLVRLLLRSTVPLRAVLDPVMGAVSVAWSPIARLFAPSGRRDRRNVQAHYDLPGELFELMLDETMAYSCAVFSEPGLSLADAQRAKFDLLCRKLELTEDDHLLEIGTGWGGLALHAAERYGCRVTTTTLSDAQREVAIDRVAAAGLADRVTVLGLHYRDLEGSGRYDKLVSVEMIEAVDWRRHDEFFATCARLLADDGLMALQAITIEDRSYERAKHHDDFIRRMIFPGGCLPSLGAINGSVGRATDLSVVDVEDIGRYYPPTLSAWRANLAERSGSLDHPGFDPAFERLWALYLSYCEGAFLERHISDVQVLLAKPAWRGGVPAGR